MKSKKILRILGLLLIISISVLKLSCNEVGQNNIPEDGAIGPEGGVVLGEDGITLDIPPGALDSNIIITAKRITASEIPIPPPGGNFLVVGVELKPDNLQFNVPITIKAPIDFDLSPGTSLPVLTIDSTENKTMIETVAFVNEDGTSVNWQLSHFSIWGVFGFNSNDTEQKRLKDSIINNLSVLLNQYAGLCFFDNNFLSLGNLSKFADALTNPIYSIDIHIDPEYLVVNIGAEAAYVESCLTCNPWYFNDIILQEDPTELDPLDSTLLHEMIHAIFDFGYSISLSPTEFALLLLGDKGETVPDYLEQVVIPNINSRLKDTVEVEYAKAREGKPCDITRVIERLDNFIEDSDNFFKSRNITPTDSILILDMAKRYTGFDVDPRVIKLKYLEEQLCGVCDPSSQPPSEICNDGIDNDLNGLIDCDDISCIIDPSCVDTCDVSSFQFLSLEEGNPRQPGDGIFVGPVSGFIPDPPFSLNGITDGITMIIFPSPNDVADFPEDVFLGITLVANDTCFWGLSFGAEYLGQFIFNGATGFAFYVSQCALEGTAGAAASGIGDCALDLTINDFSIFSVSFSDQFENPVFKELDAVGIGKGQSACLNGLEHEPPVTPKDVLCGPAVQSAPPGFPRTFCAVGGIGNYSWMISPSDNCSSTLGNDGTSFTVSCNTIGQRMINIDDQDPNNFSSICFFDVK